MPLKKRLMRTSGHRQIMSDNYLSNFGLLTNKVQELLKTLTYLKQTNTELNQKLAEPGGGEASQVYLQRISELEEEIRKLKKENKILKEREKIIKNKVERLAVKLEKIEL